MDRAEVRVDVGRVDKPSKLVGAPINITVADISFPDIEWTDNIVVVLTWWCDALTRVLSHKAVAAHVRMMEGPFVAEVEKTFGGGWKLTLFEDTGERATNVSEYAGLVEPRPLIASVLQAATETLAMCHRRGWLSKDTKELECAAAGLRSAALYE